jgi:hypothetical protein
MVHGLKADSTPHIQLKDSTRHASQMGEFKSSGSLLVTDKTCSQQSAWFSMSGNFPAES